MMKYNFFHHLQASGICDLSKPIVSWKSKSIYEQNWMIYNAVRNKWSCEKLASSQFKYVLLNTTAESNVVS